MQIYKLCGNKNLLTLAERQRIWHSYRIAHCIATARFDAPHTHTHKESASHAKAQCKDTIMQNDNEFMRRQNQLDIFRMDEIMMNGNSCVFRMKIVIGVGCRVSQPFISLKRSKN